MIFQIQSMAQKRMQFVFIFLILLTFPIWANAQESAISGEVRLHRLSLCTDVIEKNPSLEKNFFSSRDEKIVAWFQFSYFTPEDFIISWEWINPAGKLYHRGDLEMKAGNYQQYRTWYWINIKKRFSDSTFPGEWRIRILMNDKLLSEKRFFIRK